jgi:DnaJ-class molecular chaperone
MANLAVSEETCPRCGGDGVVVKGAVVGGMALTTRCPVCLGKKVVKAIQEHSHFDPQDLRK